MVRSLVPAMVLLSLWTCGDQRAATPVDAGVPLVRTDGGHLASEDVNAASPLAPDAGHVVRFVAIGDTGKGNDGQAKVGAAIGRLCEARGCDFVVLLGDNFYPSGVSSTTDPQWQTAFVQPYASVDAGFYAVLGNHDYGGNGSGTDLPKAEHELAYAKVNPKWHLPAHHYSFQVRDAEFFVADTNRSMFSIDQAARADFDGWLTRSTARWKIAFGHHPLLSNGPHGNAGSYDGIPFVPVANGAGVKRFIEDRVCGRAHAYFAGHDHSIQYLKDTCMRPGSNLQTELVVSGGGSATTGLIGRDPTWYQSDQLGFVVVELDDDTMTLTFHDVTGAVKYSRVVKHP